MTRLMAMLIGFLVLPCLAEECNEPGGKVWAKCSVCHSLDAADGHGVAPNLSGIVGKTVGKQPGFRYSRDLRKATATWDEGHLSDFLASPWDVYPGTSMAFAGLKKADDRENIICFMKENAK